ncbi:MAG: flotillin family protein [Firmicutes bacterium]|nr:flotillin family protein [Bacillota bacterium]
MGYLHALSSFYVLVLVIAVIVFLAVVFMSRFKTVGPDEAMIVTGSYLMGRYVVTDETKRRIKIIRGGGSFILPIFQQYGMLSLLSHKLDVSTPEVYTEQGVPVMADGVAIIKIGSSIEDVATAAEQFLGKPTEALQAEAQEVLEGHLRAILGTMTVEEVYRNRDRFAQEVQGVAAKDLKKMGLTIVSFTIKDVRDKQGYLDALGKPRIAAVKRDAEIAEAEAVRDARIKKALADEEGQKAELLRDTNVAEANKEKELKVASFKKEQDQAKAEADQAYNIQQARSEQQVINEQMQIKIITKEKEIEIQDKEILRRERQYDAEVKKRADAERYAVEQAAEADKAKKYREADSLQYSIEAQAKANAEQKRLEGLATADAERAKGTAEADVVRLKGLAEAEAKEKLAEAFEKYGRAAVLDIVAKMLPDLAGKIADPLQNIEKITVLDAGNGGGDGAVRLSKYVTELMALTPELLKNVSGLDLEQLITGLLQGKTEAPAVSKTIDANKTVEANKTAAAAVVAKDEK